MQLNNRKQNLQNFVLIFQSTILTLPLNNKYNTQRTHSGKHCYGKTPMQTFLDSKHIALEKNIPSDINECQILDTHNLSDSNLAVR